MAILSATEQEALRERIKKPARARKLPEPSVRMIVLRYIAGDSVAQLSRDYGVSRQSIAYHIKRAAEPAR